MEHRLHDKLWLYQICWPLLGRCQYKSPTIWDQRPDSLEASQQLQQAQPRSRLRSCSTPLSPSIPRLQRRLDISSCRGGTQTSCPICSVTRIDAESQRIDTKSQPLGGKPPALAGTAMARTAHLQDTALDVASKGRDDCL